jgi:hypothetical protein
MARKHLSLAPQDVTPELWYYEDRRGIAILHEIRDGKKYLRTDEIVIPWQKILASVKRYQKPSA